LVTNLAYYGDDVMQKADDYQRTQCRLDLR